MAKPVYFYGIHACTSLLQNRPMDALSLFVQQPQQNNQEKPQRSKPHTKAVQAKPHAIQENYQLTSQLDEILKLANTYGISPQYASKDRLSKLCNSPQHQGVVLHARPLTFATENQLATLCSEENKSCLFLILDRITDAHNLGACIRSAVAMGVDAIICPKKHTAPLTPTVAKVAVGSAELIPVIAVTNLARCINELKQSGVFVYGTALSNTAKPLYDCDFLQKTAIVMGSEGEGMRRLTAESCDHLVYIPMLGDVQSLNVSVATGMALYEVSRQRLLADV